MKRTEKLQYKTSHVREPGISCSPWICGHYQKGSCDISGKQIRFLTFFGDKKVHNYRIDFQYSFPVAFTAAPYLEYYINGNKLNGKPEDALTKNTVGCSQCLSIEREVDPSEMSYIAPGRETNITISRKNNAGSQICIGQVEFNVCVYPARYNFGNLTIVDMVTTKRDSATAVDVLDEDDWYQGVTLVENSGDSMANVTFEYTIGHSLDSVVSNITFNNNQKLNASEFSCKTESKKRICTVNYIERGQYKIIHMIKPKLAGAYGYFTNKMVITDMDALNHNENEEDTVSFILFTEKYVEAKNLNWISPHYYNAPNVRLGSKTKPIADIVMLNITSNFTNNDYLIEIDVSRGIYLQYGYTKDMNLRGYYYSTSNTTESYNKGGGLIIPSDEIREGTLYIKISRYGVYSKLDYVMRFRKILEVHGDNATVAEVITLPTKENRLFLKIRSKTPYPIASTKELSFSATYSRRIYATTSSFPNYFLKSQEIYKITDKLAENELLETKYVLVDLSGCSTSFSTCKFNLETKYTTPTKLVLSRAYTNYFDAKNAMMYIDKSIVQTKDLYFSMCKQISASGSGIYRYSIYSQLGALPSTVKYHYLQTQTGSTCFHLNVKKALLGDISNMTNLYINFKQPYNELESRTVLSVPELYNYDSLPILERTLYSYRTEAYKIAFTNCQSKSVDIKVTIKGSDRYHGPATILLDEDFVSTLRSFYVFDSYKYSSRGHSVSFSFFCNADGDVFFSSTKLTKKLKSRVAHLVFDNGRYYSSNKLSFSNYYSFKTSSFEMSSISPASFNHHKLQPFGVYEIDFEPHQKFHGSTELYLIFECDTCTFDKVYYSTDMLNFKTYRAEVISTVDSNTGFSQFKILVGSNKRGYLRIDEIDSNGDPQGYGYMYTYTKDHTIYGPYYIKDTPKKLIKYYVPPPEFPYWIILISVIVFVFFVILFVSLFCLIRHCIQRKGSISDGSVKKNRHSQHLPTANDNVVYKAPDVVHALEIPGNNFKYFESPVHPSSQFDPSHIAALKSKKDTENDQFIPPPIVPSAPSQDYHSSEQKQYDYSTVAQSSSSSDSDDDQVPFSPIVPQNDDVLI